MSEARKMLRKVAAAAYDRVAVEGQEFDLDLIRQIVVGDAAVADLGAALLDAAAEAAVSYVDESRRSRPEQTDLFGDLDRVLAIGDGRRKRKGSCTAADYSRHMEIVQANAASVAAAAAKEQAEYARLLPLLNAGLTVEQAAEQLKAES